MWSYFILSIILTKVIQNAAHYMSPCDCYQTSIFDDNEQFLIQPGENGYVDGEDTYKYCYVYQMEQRVAGYGATACQGILESILLGVCADPGVFDLDSLVVSSTGCSSLHIEHDYGLDLYGLKCKLDVNGVCNMNNEGKDCENDDECASPCMQCCKKRKKCELKPQREIITICLTVPFNNNEYFNYVGYYQDDGDSFKCGQTSEGFPYDNKGLPDLCSTAIPTTAIPTTAIPTTAIPTTAIPTTVITGDPCNCYQTSIMDDNDRYLIQPGENGYVDGEDTYKYCYIYHMLQKVAGFYAPVCRVELDSILLGVCGDPGVFDLNSLVVSSTGCSSLVTQYDVDLDLYGLQCKLDVDPDIDSNGKQNEIITICLTVPFNNNEYFNYVGYYQGDGDFFKCGQTSEGFPYDNNGLPDLCTDVNEMIILPHKTTKFYHEANTFGYIVLIGLIVFILINNIFIGCWCLRGKQENKNIPLYENCDVVKL